MIKYLYILLEWVGEKSTEKKIKMYCSKFSELVVQNVINSPWVPGVKEYLEDQTGKNKYLVTATPQKEIKKILLELEINNYFKEVIGAPTLKSDAINVLLKKYYIPPKLSVMIGDSKHDYNAAMKNGINFILRKTKLNKAIQSRLDCTMIDNFLYEQT